MKHRTAALVAILAAGALVVPIGDGIIIDATGPQAAQAAPRPNVVIGDGGGDTTCENDAYHLGRVVYMRDTVQGVYGLRYYQCVMAGGGWYVWDTYARSLFRNTVGVGMDWITLGERTNSALHPAWIPA